MPLCWQDYLHKLGIQKDHEYGPRSEHASLAAGEEVVGSLKHNVCAFIAIQDVYYTQTIVYIRIYIYIYTYTATHIHLHICAIMRVCIYIYICVCVYAYMYTHTTHA